MCRFFGSLDENISLYHTLTSFLALSNRIKPGFLCINDFMLKIVPDFRTKSVTQSAGIIIIPLFTRNQSYLFSTHS